MDLEDAHKLGILSTDRVIELLTPFINSIKNDPCNISDLSSIADPNERVGAFRAKAINCLIYECVDIFEKYYTDIMNGTFDSELTDLINHKEEFENIANIKTTEVFNFYKIVAIESGGGHVIAGLLELYLDAFKNREKKYGKNLLGILPKCYIPTESDSCYQVILKISTYLSRMTDNYAIDQYRTLTGHKFPEI